MQSPEPEKLASPDGLIIMGTEGGCGKTALMCGLACALQAKNIPTRAIKPLILGSRKSAEPELNFIQSVTRTPIKYPLQYLERPTSIHKTNWHNTILVSHSKTELTLIEVPGAPAAPICYDETHIGTLLPTWRDASDLAIEFQLPVLLVAKHASDCVEKLVTNAYYLTMHNIFVAGLVTVEVSEGLGQEVEGRMSRQDFALGLYSRTQIPYLGCLKYSPTISVPRVNPGELVKLTSNGLDLNILLRSLHLSVSV
jgi:dethiobiotin synthetase